MHSNLRGTDQRFVFAKSYRSSKENHRDGERRFAVGKLLGIHSQSFSRLDLVCDRSTSVGMRYGIRCRPKHDKCGKNVGCRQMADFWMEKGACETDDLTDFFELVK